MKPLPLLLAIALGCGWPTLPLQAQSRDRIQLRLDTTEAVAVLGLLPAGAPGPGGDWQRLFTSDGYRRLKVREAAMRLPFTDSAFAAFVTSDTLRRRAEELRRTLDAWERADIQAAAARALAYLPAQARIRATVYVVIKPRTNSFVWDTDTDPAIFLYLDPASTRPRFENTVAHELHHIGFASLGHATDSLVDALPDSVRPLAHWMGAFGEGFAMLAAAGGPDADPQAASPPAERARWQRDVARFNDDLRTLDGFFSDILTGRLRSADSIQARAMTFFGVQGPWYTVGWKMAVVIERRFGRQELIRCMVDPRRLLATYDRAAIAYDRVHADPLAQWSSPVVAALTGGSSGR